MKLKIPFYQSEKNMDCGLISLKMVFSYFGKKDFNLLEEKLKINPDKSISTIKLAVVAAELGFKVKFFSTSIYFNKDNLELDFYRKYQDTDLNENKRIIKLAKKLGIELYEKSISLDKLLYFITTDSVPIALIDWSILEGVNNSYKGHFMPLVGYDSYYVYLHNPGPNVPTPYMSIKRRLFDESRKAKGTDEDLLVISR